MIVYWHAVISQPASTLKVFNTKLSVTWMR
jgi:hypothetical protein